MKLYNLIVRFIARQFYGISSRKQWNNFKKNTIGYIYRYATTSWQAKVINEKRYTFLRKFHWGPSLCTLYHTIRFFITRKPVVPIIEYVVTTHCTMQCKNCNTFVPYFSSQTHVPMTTFDVFKNDVDRLLKSVDYILLFGFVGGEPLLSKDLDKMVAYVCSKYKIHNVFIASNCTLLPSESLIKSMKHKKISIQISDYRNVKNLPKNITCHYNEFKNILLQNNIKFSDPHQESHSMSWQTMPELYIDKFDKKNVQRQFETCWGRTCNMLHGGLLTQCTLTVHISRNMEITPEAKKEIVNIRTGTPRSLRAELIRFYSRPYSEFCHYCHYENVKYGLPCGEQIEKNPVVNTSDISM